MGPNEQELRKVLQASATALANGSSGWESGRAALDSVTTELDHGIDGMDDQMGPHTRDAALASFQAMRNRVQEHKRSLRLGRDALDIASGAIDTATAVAISGLPKVEAKPTMNDSGDPAADQVQHAKAMKSYDESVGSREAAAAKALRDLDAELDKSIAMMREARGLPPEDPTTPGPGSSDGGGSTSVGDASHAPSPELWASRANDRRWPRRPTPRSRALPTCPGIPGPGDPGSPGPGGPRLPGTGRTRRPRWGPGRSRLSGTWRSGTWRSGLSRTGRPGLSRAGGPWVSTGRSWWSERPGSAGRSRWSERTRESRADPMDPVDPVDLVDLVGPGGPAGVRLTAALCLGPSGAGALGGALIGGRALAGGLRRLAGLRGASTAAASEAAAAPARRGRGGGPRGRRGRHGPFGQHRLGRPGRFSGWSGRGCRDGRPQQRQEEEQGNGQGSRPFGRGGRLARRRGRRSGRARLSWTALRRPAETPPRAAARPE